MRDPLAFCAEELARLDRDGLRRRVRPVQSGAGPEVIVGERRVLSLASNNYLGLATHPEVTAAAAEAASSYGVGAGSARLIAGGLGLHDELEARLAAFKGTEDAVLFSSGYLANLGTIAALVGRGDAVFSDALNHASIIDGTRLSGATVGVYRHCDAGHLDELLTSHRSGHRAAAAGGGGRVLIVTDTVFSMDGDLAPVPDLVEVAERHEAILMVDEAHATGVVGPGGRGGVAHFGCEGKVPVVMGTLSKALGAAGGFIAGSAELCAWLRNRARSFIFDTSLPPPVVAAALAALGIVEREPELGRRARDLAARLAGGLRAGGFDSPEPAAAVVPVVVGEVDATMALAARLFERAILVGAIRPPTVPAGTSRLRLAVMAAHTEAQIDRVLAAFGAGVAASTR